MFESALQRDRQFNQAYMRMAETVATLSRSNKRKVGALIVNGRNIVAYGFNGTVTGMSNACEDVDNKTYPYVIHAEMNAILKAGTLAHGADMYITLFPCNECCKLMAQAGIKRIFYLEDHKTDHDRLYGDMQAIKIDAV